MKTIKIPAKVGMVSLVGVWGDYPMNFGNYFDFRNGQYCVNMWAENLEEWVERTGMTEIEIVSFDDYAFVVDNTISKKWLNQGLCFTGSGYRNGNKEEILDFAAEFFEVDRLTYAEYDTPSEERGWTKEIRDGETWWTLPKGNTRIETKEGSSWQSIKIIADRSKLDGKFSLKKVENDAAIYYSPYRPVIENGS